MSLSNAEVTRLLLVLVLLLVAAHSLGRVCTRLRQPKVAGEILGGLLLGPTLFGLLLPSWQHAVFQSGTATPAALGIFYQLGLFLLMYCSGAELRSILARRERKATLGIALLANAVPFVAGVAFLRVYDSGRFLGPAHNRTAFLLVFALAMAVTSIPVISRIMADLGILDTRFARIVLSVAVLEDLLVYVVLNFALALVAPPAAEAFTLPSLLSMRPASILGNGYYVVVTLGFFALPAPLGPGFVGRLAGWRGNVVHRASPIGFQVAFMLALTALALSSGCRRSSAPCWPAS
jgi:Kef-type K+ transport system membrane component KefB